MNNNIETTGIELSEDYKKLSNILAPDVLVYHASALDCQINKQFDLVYNWFSSFSYFSTENNEKLLKNCYNWTKDGGVFLMEMYNSYAVLNNFQSTFNYDRAYQKKIYHIKRQCSIDIIERKLLQQWYFTDKNNTLVGSYDTYTMLYFTDELITMLKTAGFNNISIFGRNKDGAMEECSFNSPRLIIKAYK